MRSFNANHAVQAGMDGWYSLEIRQVGVFFFSVSGIALEADINRLH